MNRLEKNLYVIKSQKENYIKPENIKSGVQIFNITGNLEELKGQTKTIMPSIQAQSIVPDDGYNGLTQVNIDAVDSSIDSNIIAANIKKDVTILGVTGTLQSGDYNVKIDMSNASSGSNFFAYITKIGNINTSNVTNMSSMFSGYQNLTEITSLNTSSVTKMDKMFYNCTALTTISLLDTSNVDSMNEIFSGCSKLTEVPLSDTSNVTSMNHAFVNCSALTAIPLLDTSKVTSMYNIFSGCTNLTELPLLNTSEVTNLGWAFSKCSNLITFPEFDMSKVTNMYQMFSSCKSLSNESLNNILAICANATAYISQGTNMTLSYLGLTSDQATRCTTLSNYEAFTAAGWTTGY